MNGNFKEKISQRNNFYSLPVYFPSATVSFYSLQLQLLRHSISKCSVFYTIEVLEKLKQVFVVSKNSFKEKKNQQMMCCFSAFLIAKQNIWGYFKLVRKTANRIPRTIVLTEDGYNVLLCVYKPACRAGCHLGNFYLLFQ